MCGDVEIEHVLVVIIFNFLFHTIDSIESI